MAEWLKAAVLKTVRGESLSRVRIPLSPLVAKPVIYDRFCFSTHFLARGV